jgi:hypothetical protein
VEKVEATKMDITPLLPQTAFQDKVTILVRCLYICQFQTLFSFKKACNFNLLDLASELLVIPHGGTSCG